jgi:tetratricopeptide (TPR) repeat protein
MSDEWVWLGLDEKMARRQGMPAKIPVPKEEFEGIADKGLAVDATRKWIKQFLTSSEAGKSGAWRKKNGQIVAALEVFLDKAPLWERAQKAFADNDYEKALSTLKRITSMDPDDHAARLNLASAQANARDYPTALKSFNAVRKTFQGDADYHVAVGQLHVAMQDKDAAISEMISALEAKPDCQPALDTLAKLGVLSPIYENPRDAASLIYIRSDSVLDYLTGEWDSAARDGDFFLEQLAYHESERRYPVALAAAERAMKALGSDGGKKLQRAELGRVAALRELGRHDEAIEAVRGYLDRDAASAWGCVELARCLGATGKADDARAALNRALDLDPGDEMALLLRFWPADQGDIQKVSEAIPALAAFAEAHASASGVWRSLARAKLAVGATEEGMDLFHRAVSLAPDNDELRAELWTQLGKQQRYEEILADASKLADITKRDWKLRWNEAEAYLGVEKKIEARAAFSAINYDESLHVDIRKRAKRAVKAIDEGGSGEPGAGEE